MSDDETLKSEWSSTLKLTLGLLLINFIIMSCGITAVVVVQYNPENITNKTLTQIRCEQDIKNVLNGWGIAALVIGSLVLVWTLIQIVVLLFYSSKTGLSDYACSSACSLSLLILLFILFIGALIGVPVVIFDTKCINNIEYTYWSTALAIFCILISVFSIIIISPIIYYCVKRWRGN